MSASAYKRIRVASTADIPAGRVLETTVEGVVMVICHADSRFYAVSGLCPHLLRRRPLRYGRVLDDHIQCPWHGATFDLQTGVCLLPPPGLACLEPLATYRVVEVGDQLYVEVEVEVESATVAATEVCVHAGTPADRAAAQALTGEPAALRDATPAPLHATGAAHKPLGGDSGTDQH